MIDHRLETPSAYEVTSPAVIDRHGALRAWAAVLGDRVGAPDLDPCRAPARATDLSNLPDTFIAAAQYDVFRDDNIHFSRRLLAAGVPVDLHVYGHTFHAWDRFVPDSALTLAFEQTRHDFSGAISAADFPRHVLWLAGQLVAFTDNDAAVGAHESALALPADAGNYSEPS